MASFIVEGGHKLHGCITPQGAKNEALQVLCAVLLTQDEVIMNNLPDILDVNNLIDLLQSMGVSVRHLAKGKYAFCARNPFGDWGFRLSNRGTIYTFRRRNTTR